MKYVIVGGVAGGATTAARLRRINEHSEIIMFEKGKYISYANCGLPYYIGDVIKERDALLLQTPESFNARFNVDVRVQSEVISIDSDKKTVEIREADTGKTYTETYDKLVLSPGAKPVKPPIPGVESERVFKLRNVPDTDKVKAFIQEKRPNNALVVGAGFIGLEMAENLYHLGMNVTVVEGASQVMTMLDPEMASFLHNHFKEKNVGLFLDSTVTEFKTSDDHIQVKLNTGECIRTDMVILSVGVKPDTKFIESAGVELAPNGAINVNQYFETSKKDIYAIGDAIAFENPITGQKTMAYLAGPANYQARALADNFVFANKRKYKGSIGTAIAKVFDWTAATTGANEQTLKKAGIEYQSTIITANSHAGYYPDALQMILKITFCPKTGKLYGGQIVGFDGVDKRIDMMAMVVKNNGTIWDLQDVEQAYAPPFSSAKDPVSQIGYNAENIIKGFFKPLSPYDVKNIDLEKSILLDVRTEEEVAVSKIAGSLNIPVDNLRANLDKLPKGKPVYIYCAAGLRGYIASRILSQHGYDTYNLSGGMKVYSNAIENQSNKIDACNENNSNQNSQEHCMSHKQIVEIDARGLQCPGPIMKLKEEMDKLRPGERLRQKASDPGFFKDVESWCNVTGNLLVSRKTEKGTIEAVVEKSASLGAVNTEAVKNGQTIVVFSDDMDKALASFVIANGAAAMGKKVTLFFTFWGLNVVKKIDKPSVKKDFMGTMFGMMMPNNAKKLKLSKMNMANMGRSMMRSRMKSKNVDMLEDMIQDAIKNGVELIACQMSMDIMGVHASELMEAVEIGGVANYLEKAGNASGNLFI